MLRWYLSVVTIASVAGVIAIDRRLSALRAQVEGGALAYNPLEAGFANERLAALLSLRRTVVVSTVLLAALTAWAWLA